MGATAFDRWQFRMNGKGKQDVLEAIIPMLRDATSPMQAVSDVRVYMGQRNKGAVYKALVDWERKLRNGETLASAVQGWLKPNEVMMIAAGQASNRLPMMLEFIVKQSKESEKRTRALLGLIYPIISIGAIAYMLTIFSQIIGEMATMSDPSTWPRHAMWLVWLTQNVELTLGVMAGAAIAFIIILASLPFHTGELRRRLDRFFPWSIYGVMASADFVLTLGAVTSTGASIGQALEDMREYASPWLRWVLLNIQRHFHGNFAEAAIAAGHNFPDWRVVLRLRYSGSNLNERLIHVGAEWLEQSSDLLIKQINVFKWTVNLAVMAAFGAIVLTYFSLMSEVMNGFMGSMQ